MIEFRFALAADAWPAVETLLEELGALALTRAAGDTPVFDEPGVAPDDGWQQFEVTALFAANTASDIVRAALANVLPGVAVDVRGIADADWQEQWKSHWDAQLFAGGLCVCPSWCEPPAAAGTVIRLDPGQAFGTGTHDSTGLCLDFLGNAPPRGLTVIDYGTGSGILAIAAVRLGARQVHALDIDPAAVTVAAANAAANDCAEAITVGLPQALNTAPADLVLANILLAPLLDLADELIRCVKPGGRLVLAGLLAAQAQTVTARYGEAIRFASPVNRNGWIRLDGTRRH